MSFLGILSADLRLLSLEARKKAPEVKEAAERAILKLRSLQEQDIAAEQKAEVLAKSDFVLRPFLMACESNNTKMIAIAVGSIQKLVANNALAESNIPKIMRVMSLQVESTDDTVKLKILQAIVSLLTTNHDMHGEALSQSLCICFRLHKTKSIAVKNTAAATLRQMVTMLFDRAMSEFTAQDEEAIEVLLKPEVDRSAGGLGTSNQRMPKNLPPSITDAHFLLQDLCSLTGGDTPIWLPVPKISKSFGFELIESVLGNHPTLFHKVFEFQLLLKDRICPLIIKTLQMKLGVFPYTVRLVRMMGVFIANFIPIMGPECEVFLGRLIRTVNAEAPIWLKALNLEVYRTFCSNSELLLHIFTNYDLKAALTDHSGRIFENLVKAVTSFALKVFEHNNKAKLKTEPSRTKCMDMLSSAEPPSTISLGYVLTLALDCLTGIVDAIALVASERLGEERKKHDELLKVDARPRRTTGRRRRQLLQERLEDNPFDEKGRETKAQAKQEEVEGKEKRDDADDDEEEEDEEKTLKGEPEKLDEEDKKHSEVARVELSKRMAEVCWRDMLPALSLMLEKSDDEATLASILRTYQLFVHVCGICDLPVPRNAFIYSLCHFALPKTTFVVTKPSNTIERKPELKNEVDFVFEEHFPVLEKDQNAEDEYQQNQQQQRRKSSEGAEADHSQSDTTKEVTINIFEGALLTKNVIALKTLLNIAHCMGGGLGNAWVIILSTLETLYGILHPTPSLPSIPSTPTIPPTTPAPSAPQTPTPTPTPSALTAPSPSLLSPFALLGFGGASTESTSSNTTHSGGNTPSTPGTSIHDSPSHVEMDSLSSGLDLLIEASRYLDDAAILYFITALCRLSANALYSYDHPSLASQFAALLETKPSNSGQSPLDKPKKLIIRPSHHFGTTKAVEACLQNIHRIDKVWKVIEAHFHFVANHRKASVRLYGVDAITKIIEAALARMPVIIRGTMNQLRQNLHSSSPLHLSGGSSTTSATPSTPSSTPSAPSTPVTSTPRSGQPQQSSEELQNCFMEALEKLSHSHFNDTREKTLQALFAILQSSGQRLSTGWPLVLSIVMTVAVTNDEALVQSAFKSLYFIGSDFLENLPIDCLALCVTAIGCFGMQTSHMNISLTAVGLLWNIADYLANEQKAVRRQLEEDSKREAAPPVLKKKASVLSLRDPSTASKLWISLFTELKALSTDSRPEVRNCAIQTLFKTLSTHGSLLEYDTWPQCIAEILFPLLTEIQAAAGAAMNEKIDIELGKEGGRSVVMLVHHTRNTNEKQWNETVVFAMQGIIRVFRTFFPILSSLNDFNRSWAQLLLLFESFAAGKSAEVSKNAISLLKELMHPQATNEGFARVLWENMWDTLLHISQRLTRNSKGGPLLQFAPHLGLGLHEDAATPPTTPPTSPATPSTTAPTTTTTTTATTSNQTQPQQEVSQESILELVHTVDYIHSKFRDYCVPADVKRILNILRPLALYPPESDEEASPLQEKVLKLLANLPPVAEEVQPAIFTLLGEYVLAAIHYQPPPVDNSSNKPPSRYRSKTPKQSLYHPLGKRAIELMMNYYEESSTHIRALVFEDCIKILGSAMMTKYVIYTSPLWKTAVDAFIATVTPGLATVTLSDDFSEEVIKRVWTQLYASVQEFLFHDRALLPTLSAEEQRADEEYDVELANLLTHSMLPLAGRVPFLHGRLVGILKEGASFYPHLPQQRDMFAEGCLKNMFHLCSAAVTASEVEGNTCNKAIAKMTLPVLMNKAQQILRDFVRDDELGGSCPLPRHRLLEISILLEQLRSLELEEDEDIQKELVYTRKEEEQEEDRRKEEKEEGSERKVKKKEMVRISRRKHLLVLFSLLCDCITTKEGRMRSALKEIFHLAGTELGIE